MQEVEFPDYINTMPSFFWFELDEFCVAVICLIIGYVARGLWPVAGLLIGLFLASRMKKWKRGEMEGALPQILYQKGFVAINKLYKNCHHGVLWV